MLITVTKNVLEKELKFDSVTVLTYKIEYPEFHSDKYDDTIQHINQFYRSRALQYQKYCETELFDEAVDQYKVSVESGYPVRAYDVVWTYTITYKTACVISLYSDKYEFFGGAHGMTVRDSQTWNAESGKQIHLHQLFICSNNFKINILKKIREQIKIDPSDYFEDYAKLIVTTFDESSFYCTPMELVVYYQQYDIAPYVGGIREFKIPYNSCIMNPIKFCKTNHI